MSGDVPLPNLGSIGPWGRVEGELKLKTMGVSFVQRRATISIFLSHPRWPRGFYMVGPKTFKKISNLSISTFYVPSNSYKLQTVE